MTDALLLRANGYGRNEDKAISYNIANGWTGPWCVDIRRVSRTPWMVIYRKELPQVIATIDMEYTRHINIRGMLRFLHFRQVMTVPADLRYDCSPWDKKQRNPVRYDTLESVLPSDMDIDWLELLPLREWQLSYTEEQS